MRIDFSSQQYRGDDEQRLIRLMRAARAVAAEHTLALRAATTAASPRQRLAEVRAMYVPSPDSHQESDSGAPSDCRRRSVQYSHCE